MIADRMVSFPTMVMIAAIFAAGLMMVVSPPRKPAAKPAEAVSPAGVLGNY